MATPVARDLFSRTIALMFDANTFISAPQLGQSFFGRPEGNGQTYYSPDRNLIELDIISPNPKRLATLIKRGSQKPIANLPADVTQQFGNEMYKFPLIHMDGRINASKLLDRVAGEQVSSNMTKTMRAMVLAARIYRDQSLAAVRSMEYLSWISLLTGTMPALIGTADANWQYDFQRNAGNTIAVAAGWDSDTGLAILDDVDEGCTAVILNGDVVPNFLGLGQLAMAAFLRNVEVQAFADNRRYEFIRAGFGIQVPPELAFIEANGGQIIGRIMTPKGRQLWIFGYEKTYVDSLGVAQYFLPRDQGIIGRISRFDRYYGPSEFLPIQLRPNDAGVYATLGFGGNTASIMGQPMQDNTVELVDRNAFYYSARIESNSIIVETEVAPIFATTHANALATLTGLITEES